jgi:hypothetical protein
MSSASRDTETQKVFNVLCNAFIASYKQLEKLCPNPNDDYGALFNRQYYHVMLAMRWKREILQLVSDPTMKNIYTDMCNQHYTSGFGVLDDIIRDYDPDVPLEVQLKKTAYFTSPYKEFPEDYSVNPQSNLQVLITAFNIILLKPSEIRGAYLDSQRAYHKMLVAEKALLAEQDNRDNPLEDHVNTDEASTGQASAPIATSVPVNSDRIASLETRVKELEKTLSKYDDMFEYLYSRYKNDLM